MGFDRRPANTGFLVHLLFCSTVFSSKQSHAGKCQQPRHCRTAQENNDKSSSHTTRNVMLCKLSISIGHHRWNPQCAE